MSASSPVSAGFPVSIQPLRSRSVALLLSTLAAALCFDLPAHSQAKPTPLFTQPTVIPTGNWPAAIYSADVNQDGFPDLIYIDQGALPNQPSTTHVLLNDGKGNFHQSAVLATTGNSLAIGDLTGAGHIDLGWLTWTQTTTVGAAINGTETLQIAPGHGDGSFAVTQILTFSATPLRHPAQLAYLTAGRAHASGPLDVYAQDTANNLIFTFRKATSGSSPVDMTLANLPDGPGPMQILDLNGDGVPDVVVNGLTGLSAQIFLRAGAPTFGFGDVVQPQRFSGVSGIHSILVQDVDNDSIPDLITEGANGRFDIFHGNGDGTFQTTSEGGSLTLDGLTGHGGHLIAETTVANGTRRNFYTATPAGISVLTGNGNLTYTLQGIYNAGPGRTSYAFADFNGDGYPDLALDSPEGIAILYGNPDGSFQTSQAFAAGQPALSAALGKLTSSGHMDAVVSTGSTQAQALLGDGTGAFTAVGGASAPTPTLPQNGVPGLWSAVALADFNGDGLLDLAITADGASSNSSGGVLIPSSTSANPFGVTFQYGKGDGTFGAPVPLGFTPSSGTPGFFYGKSALAPQVYPGTPASLANTGYSGAVLFPGGEIGNGVGEVTSGPLSGAHNLIAAADLRGTGVDDLLVQNGGSLQILLNDGSARFLGHQLGDLSIDGSLTTPGQLTAPALSPTFNGPAIPVASGGLGFPAFIGSAVFADLDGDGNNDLIVAYDNLAADHTAPNPTAAPNYLYLWYGSGGGKFLTSAKHPVNPVRLTPSRNFYQVAIADLNGDKIPDLILSDGYVLSVQYGNGDGSFQAERHFLAGQGLNTISVGDVNGDGRPDLILANGGTLFSNPVANKEVLTPNPDVNTGGITVLLNTYIPMDLQVTSTLSASPNPAPFEGQPTLPVAYPGQSITVTATLSTSAGASQPNGTVAFYLDTNTQPTGPPNLVSLGAPVNVDNGTASILIPSSFTPVLLPGVNYLVASYSGDYVYGPEPAFGTTLTISLGPTSVVLTPTTPLTVSYGAPINGTFAISVVDNTYPYTGTYTLFDNGIAVPECTNLSPTLECPYGAPQLLNAGPHVFTVAYNGGPANGDPINASSVSAPIAYTVIPDTTTASLTSSINPAPFGTAVTFTATLAGNMATPTGTVQFLDNGAVIGTGNLNAAGVATFTTSSLAVGTHPITAFYPGTTNFNASTSNTVQQQIVTIPTLPQYGGFTLTITPNPVSIGVGRTAVLLVTVQDSGDFDQPVQLSCSNLPAESVCTFAQTIIPAGGGSTTLQVSTAAPHDCGDPGHPYFLGSNASPGRTATLAALLLFGLTGGGLLRKRRTRRGLFGAILLLAALAGLTALNGCGHCTDLGTRPATYTLRVTGTAQGTPSTQTQTQPLTLTVTL